MSAFTRAWPSDDLAYVHAGTASFLLQNLYVKAHADNFMTPKRVKDGQAWWGTLEAQEIGSR